MSPTRSGVTVSPSQTQMADPNFSQNIDPIGLLAGWGRYPIVVAESLRRRGHRVIGLGVRDHADPQLAQICDEFRWIGLGSIGFAIRQFRAHNVRRAVMAGKVHKVTFYR